LLAWGAAVYKLILKKLTMKKYQLGTTGFTVAFINPTAPDSRNKIGGFTIYRGLVNIATGEVFDSAMAEAGVLFDLTAGEEQEKEVYKLLETAWAEFNQEPSEDIAKQSGDTLLFEVTVFPYDGEEWNAVEVEPVCYLNKEDHTQGCEVCEESEADFYSVYLRQSCGGVQCIADCTTKERADAFAALIERIVETHKPYTHG
jgi:hypothetical protein